MAVAFPTELIRTLSLEEALHDYLTAREEAITTITDPLRSEARKQLRDLVGICIFSGRRPRSATGRTAVTLQTQTVNREYFLVGQHEIVDSNVGIDVWSKDDDQKAKRIVDRAWRYLTILLTDFRGQWSGIEIHGCQVDDSANLPIRPSDASDGWTMRSGGIARITYAEQVPHGIPEDY